MGRHINALQANQDKWRMNAHSYITTLQKNQNEYLVKTKGKANLCVSFVKGNWGKCSIEGTFTVKLVVRAINRKTGMLFHLCLKFANLNVFQPTT